MNLHNDNGNDTTPKIGDRRKVSGEEGVSELQTKNGMHNRRVRYPPNADNEDDFLSSLPRLLCSINLLWSSQI